MIQFVPQLPAILIATTNHPERLDTLILERPSRL